MRPLALMWAALATLVGVCLFLLKYQVQALEDELHAKQQQIERDRGAIRVLEAEWTYLNDPGRLRRLSEQHLGFGAPNAKQVLTISQLPYRNGFTPNPEAVATPPATEATDAPSLRSASADSQNDSVTSESTAQGAVLPRNLAMASPRTDAITATVARLQKLLPPFWSGPVSIKEPSP
ncbi:MAG: hypothetical protein SFV19_00895 [Rhodospirillaceae bacterium]|nr:hypothetical protein [Rhodospirillaceae bacterium]